MDDASRERERIRGILGSAKTVAVLGASPKPERAGYYVPEYLASKGYRILPVNPAYVGRELFGAPVAERLDRLAEPVDIVDVFRSPDALPGHLDEVLAMDPPPKVVWLQTGIRHDEFAAALEAAGIEVVQDACAMAAHRLLFRAGS